MKYKLSELIDIKHGYAFKGDKITFEECDNILVTPGNFNIGGGFKYNKFKYFNGEYSKEYVLRENDIIITMTDLSKEGDTLGYAAKVPKIQGKVLLHNQRIGLVEFLKEKEVLKEYIYWYFRTRSYQSLIVATATGSTVKHTSPSRILECEIEVPGVNRQIRIVNLLESLEQKILLNNKLNDNLIAA